MKNNHKKTGQTVLAESAKTGGHPEKASLQINDLDRPVRLPDFDLTPAKAQGLTLDELATEIRLATTAMTASARIIALSVYAARQIHFQDQPADWLAWAARECGIKRSHCFCLLLVGRMLSQISAEMYELCKNTDITKLEIVAGAPEPYWTGLLSDAKAMSLPRDELRAHVARLTGAVLPGSGDEETEQQVKTISRLAGFHWADEAAMMKTLDGLTIEQCSRVGQFGLAVVEAQCKTGRIRELPADERQELADEMIRLAEEIKKIKE